MKDHFSSVNLKTNYDKVIFILPSVYISELSH